MSNSELRWKFQAERSECVLARSNKHVAGKALLSFLPIGRPGDIPTPRTIREVAAEQLNETEEFTALRNVRSEIERTQAQIGVATSELRKAEEAIEESVASGPKADEIKNLNYRCGDLRREHQSLIDTLAVLNTALEKVYDSARGRLLRIEIEANPELVQAAITRCDELAEKISETCSLLLTEYADARRDLKMVSHAEVDTEKVLGPRPQPSKEPREMKFNRDAMSGALPTLGNRSKGEAKEPQWKADNLPPKMGKMEPV